MTSRESGDDALRKTDDAASRRLRPDGRPTKRRDDAVDIARRTQKQPGQDLRDPEETDAGE